MIWLAYLLSAALLAVGGQIPGLTVASAEAATTIACATSPCGASATQDFQYTSPANSWAVVGVRSATGAGNANVCLYRDAPLTQQLACSSLSGNTAVDFVAVDYHLVTSGIDYVRSTRASGSGDVCTGLDCAATTLVANAASLTTSWSAGTVVRAFNLAVGAGTYRVGVSITSGTADLGLAVFNSAGVAGYAAGRTGAVAQADARPGGLGEGLYFTSAGSDTLCLVIFSNTAAGTANYRIDFRTAKKLVPNVASIEGGTNAADFLYIPTAPLGWSVVALRPTFANPAPDADIKLYTSPDYLTQLERSSAEPGIVDFIVVNYANVPEDTAAVLMISLGPIGGYKIDWAYNATALGVNAPAAVGIGSRVGAAWHANLFAGVEYTGTFTPTAGTQGDAALGLYGPTMSAPVFTRGTRADSLQGSDVWGESVGGWSGDQGVEVFAYTPQVAGDFLFYLYQKTAKQVAGTLLLEASSLVGVIGPGAASGGFATPRPSPARAGENVRFAFNVPAGGPVRLAVYDARGRLVRVVSEGDRAPGPTFAVWDGRTADGLRAAPGLYFARLERAGLAVETRRLVRLD